MSNAYRRRIVTKPNAIRIQRIREHLEATDVAARVGLSIAQYGNIESGRSGTTEKTAIRIVDLLRVDFAELFEILPGANEGLARNGNAANSLD